MRLIDRFLDSVIPILYLFHMRYQSIIHLNVRSLKDVYYLKYLINVSRQFVLFFFNEEIKTSEIKLQFFYS